MVDASKAIRHGDVRMVASLVNQFFGTQPAYSSYAMLILVSHRRVQGWDSDAIAEDHRMCYFAGLWNSLDVAMEGGALVVDLLGVHREQQESEHSPPTLRSRSPCASWVHPLHRRLVRGLFLAPHHHDPKRNAAQFCILGCGGVSQSSFLIKSRGFASSGASGTYISLVEVGRWIRHSSDEAFVSPYEDNTVLALYRILAGQALSCWTGELDERIVGRCICAMYSVTRLDESSVCVVSPPNEGWHTHRCVTKIFTPKFVAY